MILLSLLLGPPPFRVLITSLRFLHFAVEHFLFTRNSFHLTVRAFFPANIFKHFMVIPSFSSLPLRFHISIPSLKFLHSNLQPSASLVSSVPHPSNLKTPHHNFPKRRNAISSKKHSSEFISRILRRLYGISCANPYT